MKTAPGVYTLVLDIYEDTSLRLGAWGLTRFQRGLYVYTGSAQGTGGLDARIMRHLRREKKIFWHIDHLTSNPRVSVLAFVKAEEPRRTECVVNRRIRSRLDAEPIQGFGSSDCRESCLGHLLAVGSRSLSMSLEGIKEAYRESGLNPIAETVENRVRGSLKLSAERGETEG